MSSYCLDSTQLDPLGTRCSAARWTVPCKGLGLGLGLGLGSGSGLGLGLGLGLGSGSGLAPVVGLGLGLHLDGLVRTIHPLQVLQAALVVPAAILKLGAE